MSDLDVQNINSKTGNSAISIADDGTTTVSTFTSTGIDDNATSTAITIDASENVGIGETSPARKLDVLNTSGAVPVRIGNTGSTGSYVEMAGTDGSVRFGHSSAGVFSLLTGGDSSYAGEALAMTIDASGNLTATGNITAYSDERLKSDIETLDGSKVYEMRGVSFTKDGEASSGVIAQELQKVAPELVNESGEYLSVAYGNLVGYLIEAVKELKAEIDELKGAK